MPDYIEIFQEFRKERTRPKEGVYTEFGRIWRCFENFCIEKGYRSKDRKTFQTVWDTCYTKVSSPDEKVRYCNVLVFEDDEQVEWFDRQVKEGTTNS